MASFKTYRWCILGVIALLYFLVCLHRVAPTVIARDLVLSLKMDAFILGLISSAYFYLYSAMQPWVGFLTDSIGPRKVIITFYFIAGLGSILFGLAPTPFVALLGRALVGLGMAGVFIPALKIFSHWYAPEHFSGLTGLMLTVGGLGGISASLPLTYMVELTGWRLSFIILGLTSLLLTTLAFLIIRDSPSEMGWISPYESHVHPPSSAGRRSDGRIIFSVLKRGDFWLVSCSTFFTGGVFLTFQGLWCVPYLTDVFHLSRLQAGWILMLLPLGFAVGGPSFGFLTEYFKLNRKLVIILSLFVSLGLWLVLIFLREEAHLISIFPLFFLLGLIAGGILPLFFTIIRDLFSSELMGTATGFMNTAAFIGAAIYQPLSGHLLDFISHGKNTYTFEDFRVLFLFFLLSQLAALTLTSFMGRKK
ncbi:MAG TPA: MFS transporter [Syntrophales bacterium]|nr:MFS transporter [Syntrophales bacterium]